MALTAVEKSGKMGRAISRTTIDGTKTIFAGKWGGWLLHTNGPKGEGAFTNKTGRLTDLLKHLFRTYKKAILERGTGSGKIIIASKLCRIRPKRLYMLPRGKEEDAGAKKKKEEVGTLAESWGTGGESGKV